MSLARLQKVLVAALGAEDPVAALAAACGDHSLTDAERDHLAGVDPDGLRLTALLVVKLRFESILRGDPELRRCFDRDPGRFTALFADYIRAEPRHALFPVEEAARFSAFVGNRD